MNNVDNGNKILNKEFIINSYTDIYSLNNISINSYNAKLVNSIFYRSSSFSEIIFNILGDKILKNSYVTIDNCYFSGE